MVKEFDLNQVTVAELNFDAPWQISMRRNDYVHAFVTFFTVEFSACHKRTGFSTGPEARYTHWKQTVFYLSEDLVCSEGDSIRGRIGVKPNEKNNRDQDIWVQYEFSGELGS